MEALCADLSDDEWQAQSLCPDWTVRGVVDHVTSIEAVMAGWLPEDDTTLPPFERAAEFLADTTPPLRRSRRPGGCPPDPPPSLNKRRAVLAFRGGVRPPLPGGALAARPGCR